MIKNANQSEDWNRGYDAGYRMGVEDMCKMIEALTHRKVLRDD
jgi:hypothetical protein